MRTWVSRAVRGLLRLEDALLVGLLLTMVGLAVLQIVLRNGFDGGFLWAESFLRVLVLWIGLAGAMAASREHRHISIDILSRFLPPRAATVVAIFNALFTAGIAAALAWYTLDFVLMEYEAPVMAFGNVPTWMCEAIMPFAFTVIALRYLLLAALLPWRGAGHGATSHGIPVDGGAP